MKNYETLVLNADYRPMTVIDWKRSICHVMEERADQVDFYKDVKVHDGKGRAYPVPAVIALRKYVRLDYNNPTFNRKNLLLRDNLTCQYCEQRFAACDLTFDHVIPRSKWTKQSTPTCWENIVACCLACNRRKADKSCSEAKMFPVTKPKRPEYGELFLGISPWKTNIPDEWVPYLANLPIMRSHRNEQGSQTLL
jgi:5-methylcytosine-specific restriction endonuclease McrA